MNDISGNGRQGKLAETIAESIKKDIIKRGWPVGEILGNEPQLQERYSVSRATIREAIRQLERHGVASMRRGTQGGLVVQQPAKVSAVLALATYLELTNISFEELFEARLVVESMALEQVAERFPDSEVKRAREFIEALKSPSLRTFADEMTLHTDIRNFLSEMAKNPATSLILDALYYVTVTVLPPNANEKDIEKTLRKARATRVRILEALVGGDVDTAKSAQKELLTIGRWLIEKQSKTQKNKQKSEFVQLQSSPNSPVNEIYNKTAQRLALAIIHDINSAGLKPDDRLGTESELQRQYDVSRAVLREALRILELHSIIVSKRGYGGGLMVSEPRPDYTSDVVISYLEYYNFDRHYFYEVWKTLQLATSKLAAERIDGEDRKRLEYYLDRQRHASPKEYLAAVNDLEVAIADASGNRALSLFARVLSGIARSYPSGDPPAEVIRKFSSEHEKIVKAIMAGEAGMARRHMLKYFKHISVWFGPEVRKTWLSEIKKNAQQ